MGFEPTHALTRLPRFQQGLLSLLSNLPYLLMEPVGVEPTSAQGNHTLSTRLFQPSIFVCRQDLDHQPTSYPLNLHQCIEAYTDYFRLNLHRLLSGFGTTSSERCLVQLSNSRIKPVTYCTSVRQRERNCFRQLIV